MAELTRDNANSKEAELRRLSEEYNKVRQDPLFPNGFVGAYGTDHPDIMKHLDWSHGAVKNKAAFILGRHKALPHKYPLDPHLKHKLSDYVSIKSHMKGLMDEMTNAEKDAVELNYYSINPIVDEYRRYKKRLDEYKNFEDQLPSVKLSDDDLPYLSHPDVKPHVEFPMYAKNGRAALEIGRLRSLHFPDRYDPTSSSHINREAQAKLDEAERIYKNISKLR